MTLLCAYHCHGQQANITQAVPLAVYTASCRVPLELLTSTVAGGPTLTCCIAYKLTACCLTGADVDGIC